MAVIDLKGVLSSAKFTVAEYDDVTGDVTLQIATGETLGENVIKELILGLEESAQGKRENINSPISEKSFPDAPQFSFAVRTEGETTETQVEYQPQLVLWLKSFGVTDSDAVNASD